MGCISEWLFSLFVVGALCWTAMMYVYSDGKMFLISRSDDSPEKKAHIRKLGFSFVALIFVGVLALISNNA